MSWVWIIKALNGIALVTLLVGCIAPGEVTNVPMITASPTESTFSPTRIADNQALPDPGKTSLPPTATPALNPTSIPMIATAEPCSPLKDFSLQELTEIISAPYNPPPMGKDDRHQGVDFSFYRRGERESIQGLEIQAILPGLVAATIPASFPFGNLLIIETPGSDLPAELQDRFEVEEGESLYLLYAHMENVPMVQLGDKVAACQVLGQVGKSGNAGIAHLHLEVRTGPPDARFTEFGYYQVDDTPEERQNYLFWRTSGVFQHYDPMELFN